MLPLLNVFDRLSKPFAHTQALLTFCEGGAPAGSKDGILPGGDAPGAAPTVNPTLAEVATLADWFGHPETSVFNGMVC